MPGKFEPSDPDDRSGLVWEGADYPRVSPGEYWAVCIGAQGPQWVKAFRRWGLRLEFSLLDCGTLVSYFLNFGSGHKACVQGPRSSFYRAWSLANGELPRKGQNMTPDTFVDPSLHYLLRVADCTADAKGGAKPDALVYSRVTEILKVERK